MSRFLKLLAFFLLGLTLFFFVWQKAGAKQIISAFNLFWGPAGFLAFACTALFVIFGALRWRGIWKSKGSRFSFRDLADIWLAGSSITYLMPFAVFGGEVFEIYFLGKRFKNLKKPRIMSAVAIDKLLDATVFFIFLICGVLSLAFFGYLPGSLFGLGLFLSAGVFLFILLVFYLRRAQGKSALEWLLGLLSLNRAMLASGNGAAQDIFLAEKEVFKFFSFKNKALWFGFALTLLKYSFQLLRIFFLVFFLTGQIGFLKPLAVFGFVALASLAPTPAALGSLELASGLAFSALGLGFGQGVVFSAVFRLCDLIVYAFGLLLFMRLSALSFKERILGFFHR